MPGTPLAGREDQARRRVADAYEALVPLETALDSALDNLSSEPLSVGNAEDVVAKASAGVTWIPTRRRRRRVARRDGLVTTVTDPAWEMGRRRSAGGSGVAEPAGASSETGLALGSHPGRGSGGYGPARECRHKSRIEERVSRPARSGDARRVDSTRRRHLEPAHDHS
jgi:hypothetical protein